MPYVRKYRPIFTNNPNAEFICRALDSKGDHFSGQKDESCSFVAQQIKIFLHSLDFSFSKHLVILAFQHSARVSET